MPVKEDEAALTSLLKRLATPSAKASAKSTTLSSSEISLVADSLLPSSSRSARSLAFLCLSKHCELKSSSSPNSDVRGIYSTFKAYVESVFVDSTANAFSLSASATPAASITLLDDNDDVAQLDSQTVPAPSPTTGLDTQPESCLPLTYLLSNLFSLAPESTVKLLTTPLITSDNDELGDTLEILLELAELPSPLQLALAELLSNAAGSKKGREMVRSRALDWLKGALDYREGERNEEELGVLCAVALSKLGRKEDPLQSQAQAQDQSQEADEKQGIGMEDELLCRKMMAHIESSTSSSPSPALISTIEGLAILSLRPKNKVILASSPVFLKRLLALSPVKSPKPGSLPVTPRGSMDITPESNEGIDTGLCYGLTTLLVNLTSPKPILSAEDQQIAKLRAMAISANKGKLNKNAGQEDADDEDAESEEEVRKRTKAVVKAGGITALAGLGRAGSLLVKQGLGKLCRNIVEDQADRLPFVRDGGFKVLSNVTRDLLTAASATQTLSASKGNEPTNSPRDIDVLPAFQAMAKMIITTPPHLLFPPPHQTTSLNSLTPLYQLLVHPSASSLQRFESLMALTNLASIDPSIASKIVLASVAPLNADASWRGSGRDDTLRLIVRVEELMLDENELVRRAACQLVCNLVSSQAGYEYFSGESITSTSAVSSTKVDARVKSRLNILLVLSGSDDLQTRLAVSGGLAIITESPNACATLFSPSTIASKPDTTDAPSATIETVSGSRDAKKTAWTRVSDLVTPEQEEELDEDGEPIPLISSAPSLPNPDLVHRGVIILLNLVTYTLSLPGEGKSRGIKDIRDARVVEKLMDVLRMKVGEEVLEPTVECLKMLKKAQI